MAPDLSNLRPDELYSRLESAALAIFTARPVEVTNSDSEYVRRQQESATAAMFSRAGVRDPLEAYNRYDAEQAAAAQRRQEQADKDYQEFSPDQPPQPAPTWDDTVRSMTGDW